MVSANCSLTASSNDGNEGSMVVAVVEVELLDDDVRVEARDRVLVAIEGATDEVVLRLGCN